MTGSIRVATWNAWWRFGDWEARGRAMAETLVALDADVISLQEAWAADGDGLAPRLADRLGYHVVFEASPAPAKWHRRLDGDRSQVGNAVLSRWPLTEPSSLRLPPGDREHQAGDLIEEFHDRARRRGTFAARVWAWRQAFRCLVHRAANDPLHDVRRSGVSMSAFIRDVAFALRLVRRTPLISAAVLTSRPTASCGTGMW